MEGSGGPPARERPGLRARMILSLFVTATVLSGVMATWIVDRQLRGPIESWSRAVVENLATRAISTAMRDHLGALLSATQLSHPIYDGAGRLQGITYETGEINRIAFEATLGIQEALEAATATQLPVPLGQILGLDFLAAFGPRLSVRIVPAGSVEATPRAEFHQAGINQTVHSILLDVTVRAQVVVPLFPERVTVTTSVPITEQLVVGQVPLVYLEWSGDPRSLPEGLRWEGTTEPEP